MTVRLRRLKADYDKLSILFTQASKIKIKKALGDPPEKYQLEYLVAGLEKTPTGHLHQRSYFLVEISLTGAYPRMAPQCRMLTPVFHPNIAPHAICVGDHWAAGESLSNLVIRIAEMLAFQSYNLKSPLNGEAAKWVAENKTRLPLDHFDFTSLLSIGEATHRDGLLAGSGATAVCANCGKTGTAAEMVVCLNRHVACRNCVMACPVCQGVVCLKCQLVTCTKCGRSVCQNCGHRCASCQQVVCAAHCGTCHVCRRERCVDCVVECANCGRTACVEHVVTGRCADGVTRTVCHPCQHGQR